MTTWYCRHYCEHFSKPEYAAAMAVIPQVNITTVQVDTLVDRYDKLSGCTVKLLIALHQEVPRDTALKTAVSWHALLILGHH